MSESSKVTPAPIKDSPKTAKLWGGRFTEETDPLMKMFNSSINVDKVMWEEDIQGSICYTHALLEAGLICKEDAKLIEIGLTEVASEWKAGSFTLQSSDEDIHTANERRLVELVGSVGGMVHTGRSRNDQVAVDMRLWLRNNIKTLAREALRLSEVLVERANDEIYILMPGYTHLQRAQPIRWSHLLLSWSWAIVSDLNNLKNLYTRVNVCPLGSGALAGNPFKIDRQKLASELGFGDVTNNSLFAVSDRDFVTEFLFWTTLTSSHISRIAEDLILYSTQEFGFVQLADAYSTGSSIMPQKKNPDSLELIRGKCANMLGKLTGFLCVMKGLPSTYNKDLQEDKEALFDSMQTIRDILQIATGVVATLSIDKEKCREALSEDMLATDIAYYLVRKGVPFREAHRIVGKVVKLSEDLKCPLSQLNVHQLKEINPLFESDIKALWNFEYSVEQYAATGGTGSASVLEQIRKLKTILKEYKVDA